MILHFYVVLKAVPFSMIHMNVQEVQCENFFITQISRELNIGESISAKSAIFNTFGGSHSFLIFAFF